MGSSTDAVRRSRGMSVIPIFRLTLRAASPAREICLCVAILATLLVGRSWPQAVDAVAIKGVVQDEHGRPVSSASVHLEAVAGTPGEASTGKDGSFVLSAPRAGSYAVTAKKEGFADVTRKLSAEQASRQVILVLPARANDALELSDQPNFTVAGITDNTGAGGHGSGTNMRTSEALARQTVALKPAPNEAPDAHGRGKTPSTALDQVVAYQSEGDFDKARELVKEQIARADSADLHRVLGDIEEQSGDSLKAVNEFETAVRMDPSEPNYFAWGSELLLHKAVKPAIEVFKKGSSAHAGSARMLAGLGAAFYASGQYEAAAASLCKASDLKPDDSAPYLFLGQMQQAAPDPLDCVEARLARYAQQKPADARANYYYAVALGKGKQAGTRPNTAEALLKKAVASDPGFAEANLQLGIVQAARGDVSGAIVSYQKALHANPNLSAAHYRLAATYKQTGNEAKAREEFQAYRAAEKSETAEIEKQRHALQQFLIVLKDAPAQ